MSDIHDNGLAEGFRSGSGGSAPMSHREPIAIVGIGCRFPGDANDPRTFWNIVRNGLDVLSEIPPDRWSLDHFYDPQPGRLGRTNVKYGGFIKGIADFDAEFFGISPREAAFMDPQQRLLLEVAWEALEDGGQVLERVTGTNTSVFIGIASFDYALIQSTSPDRETIDVYTNTGGALSIAANRISYCFNFKGPSAAVDTACSSSLFAIHLGCESIWNKISPMSVVGGVHVLISPGPYIGFSRLNMLSADGRCKAFDARANGFVRSEGAGVVVLKPLSAALADGDKIYAMIRGAAINQDGRTPGLTVPSERSQANLIRQACREAGVSPSKIQFVEAHGTGTLVGDPIEARALGEVLGVNRPIDQPCFLGSVKTNIGHLEAGAGMAGLIKTAMALKHREIPPNLHFEVPNPEIPLEELRLRVPVALQPWPASDGPAFAGVNSFGFGGTNAHVVMEEAPRDLAKLAPSANGCHGPSRPYLVPLSARSEQALVATAKNFVDWLSHEGSNASFEDICRSAALRRTHHDYRLSVVAGDKQELAERLRRYAAGDSDGLVVADRVVPHQQPKLAFVCSGQGPQWWAMGRQLLAGEPVFRDMIERCDRMMRTLGEWSLIDELTADEDHSRMQVTAISQPAIFAIQVALAALWESWGVTPDAVVGHSVGEAAAAYIAGALSFEDAVRVIYHRGRCMEKVPARGRMLAVEMDRDEAEELALDSGGKIFLAAVNGAKSMTLSGDADALEAVAVDLQQRKAFNRFLQVQYAFHSAQMDPVCEPLLAALRDIKPHKVRIPLYSTVTGEAVDGPELTGEYWWRNVRQAVLFADAMDRLIDSGHTAAVELSPHPVLGNSITDCFRARGKKVKVFTSLRRKEDERPTMLRALGGLHAAGRAVDWSRVVPSGREWVRMPTYAWQHERFWQETDGSRNERVGHLGHRLLGAACHTPQPAWESKVDCRILPYMADHRVQGAALIPATGYLETALAAAIQTTGPGTYFLEDVRLLKACFLPQGQTRVLRTTLDPDQSTFEITSRKEGGEKSWTTHVRGTIRQRQDKPPISKTAIDELKARCPREMGGADCYAMFKQIGLDYGPTFQGIERIWQGQSEALSRVSAPELIAAQLTDYHCHPALFDACWQSTIGVFVTREDSRGAIILPVEVEQVRVYGPLGPDLWSHARLVEKNRQGVVVDVHVYDDAGQLLVDVRGLQCQIIGGGGTSESLDELLYEYQWLFQPRAVTASTGPREMEFLGSLEPVRASGIAYAEQVMQEVGMLDRFAELEPGINRLCSLYIQLAFRNLGGQFDLGRRFTTEEAVQRLGIVPQHHRIFARYVGMLADDGLLRRDGDGWIVIDELAREDPQPLWNRLLASNPSSFAELTLVRRCALQLHEVLRGTVNPLHLIFPDGSLAIAEHLYQDSPTVRFYNQLAQRAIHQALENLPAGRTVRVLEIGAGTGGLTSFVLPMLPEGRTEYTFTDLSNHFFVKAEQKFADYPFIKYQKLDIERSPLEQGFVANSFDLVLASQVLHATAELKQTVTGIREVMSSRGLLVLLEAVKPARWVDMVFGLTEGWWRFVDRDRRPEYPLMTVAGWQKLLGEIGFTDTVDIAGVKANEALGSAVILSRGPSLALCGVPAALHGTGSACGNNHDVACCHDQPRSAVAATDEDAAPGSWIILADQGGAAEKLAAILRSRGAHCSLVFSGDKFEHDGDRFKVAANSADDMRNMLSIALGSDLPACRGIVDLWNLDLTDIDRTLPDDVVATQDRGAFHVVSLIQAWNDLAGDRTIPLWLVTCQAQSVNAARDGILPLQTPVWGLGRVIMNEYPRLRARLVDLGDGSTRELLALADEVWTPDDEDEIAIRGDARYVHRFASTSIDKQGVAADKRLLGRNSSAANAADGTANAERAYRLQVSSAGLLDGLTLRAFERTEPATGQVEILVRAAALNFSDVMKALGLYPGLPDGPVAVGIECAGVVSAVGPDVTEFKVGDEVLAIAPFSFASHVITSTLLVAPKPSHITFEEAATIPIAFLTAAYALDYLGRLEPGERVLIHAASGGVGLAAIQLARRTGAEIFATAGSPDKRQFLNALGIEHVMDSRSLAFADEVMETTNGRGVDVVLNSLSGEAIPKGLQCLADYGRFLEIGKRDIYGNSRIGLKPFRKNLSFMAIDLDRAMREKPHVLANLFRQVVRDVAEKKLYALPHRVFSITNVVAAFRYMSQAKHIGKVVMTMHDRVVPAPDSRNSLTFRPDATYLLSGGLGGFGLTVAKWLVDQGARHLVLMGRRGIHSPEVERQVEDLRRAGATVVVAKADVSRSQDVAGVLADIARDMPPLRGVFHAAMFLEDSLLVKLDHDRWSKIMLPKVNGAWHLHTQTLGMSLDYFVMFSSMTSVFGLAGQASYAASNTFLDSLAYYRQARGLPGLSISWGYLAEVGWVARNEAVAERLEGQGVKSYSPRQALALLGGLMQYRSIHVCVGNVDWANMRSLETAGNISKRFAGLRKQLDKNQDGPKQDGASIRKAILAAKPDQQLEMMAGVIRDKVARVLGTNVDRVVVDKPLTELGLDSLMAVELRNWIEGELRVNLPIVELMQGPTINRVAEILLAQMSPDAAPKAEPPAEKKGPPAAPVPAAVTADRAADANGNGHGLDGERAAELLENIDDLSDDEVNALLRSLQSEKE